VTPVPPLPLTVSSNAAGRWYLGVLGIIVALLGCCFVWLMGRSFLRAYEMRSWPEIPCVILSSEVDEKRHDQNSSVQYRQAISYGYEWNGQPATGDHLALRGSPWSSNRELIEARNADYPVGKSTTCRVDPHPPHLSVLKLESLAPGYSIWFPCLFVIGGLGITFRAIKPRTQLGR
jgi:Protein of unknown function (DUF3592)